MRGEFVFAGYRALPAGPGTAAGNGIALACGAERGWVLARRGAGEPVAFVVFVREKETPPNGRGKEVANLREDPGDRLGLGAKGLEVSGKFEAAQALLEICGGEEELSDAPFVVEGEVFGRRLAGIG